MEKFTEDNTEGFSRERLGIMNTEYEDQVNKIEEDEDHYCYNSIADSIAEKILNKHG